MNRFMTWVMAAVLASGLFQTADRAIAAVRYLVPDETDLPFYVRGTGHTRDGQTVGAVFYRSWETAPGNITINQYVAVDPAVYPLNVEGFVVRKEGDIVPMVMLLTNQPGEVVEMVFFSADDFFAVDEGGVTVDEIRAMPSLDVGYADKFLEIQQPSDRDILGKGFHHGFVASGVLDDGRPFSLKSVLTGGTYHVDLTIGESGASLVSVPEPASLLLVVSAVGISMFRRLHPARRR